MPKNELPTDVDYYRPISVLPVLSKIYERLVLTQLLEYIQQWNVLRDTVSGYWQEHSTSTILLRIRDDIIKAMKKGEVTLIAFADFSKAFDTVNYRAILKLLHSIGFSHGALTWIFNYLSGRRQFVQINDKQSSILDVYFGVPKGSILGPVLFNLYVNNLQSNTLTAYPSNTLMTPRFITYCNYTQTK